MLILYVEILNRYFILDNEDDDEGYGYFYLSLMVIRKVFSVFEVFVYKFLEMFKVFVYDIFYG